MKNIEIVIFAIGQSPIYYQFTKPAGVITKLTKIKDGTPVNKGLPSSHSE
jgi:hypothetical protein